MNATELRITWFEGRAVQEAHETAGKIVLKAWKRCGTFRLSLDDLRSFSKEIESDVFDFLTLEQT